MLDSIKEKIDGLEMLAANFIRTRSGMIFTKEKITELLKTGPNLPFEFEYLLVTISPNGGLIAMCSTFNYLETGKTGIDKNILVMHQDAGRRYYIPNNWRTPQCYLVSLEFNEKEQLYGFCNNGTLLKFDILTNKGVEKVNNQIFLEEGIVKAKLFDKGFIALTQKGNIYYAQDIKNPIPVFMVNIKEQLGFSNDVDFLGIPPNKSRSGKFELLLINEKGNGLLHIERQDSADDNNKLTTPKKVPISLLVSEKLEKYAPESQTENKEWEDAGSKKSLPILGKINAMCMSPSKREIAVYCAQNSTAYIFSTNLDKCSFEKLTFKIENLDSDLSNEEINEHKALFSFNRKYQFLFCGERSLAIGGQRYIVIINRENEILSFKVIEGNSMSAITGNTLFKAINEIDGVRYLSKEGVFLISEVSQELYDTCNPFNKKSPVKKLISAYGAFLSRNADCDKQIRDIAQDLPDAISTLQTAAVNIYFTERNNDNNLKDLQMLLIKASQYGKSFVQKGDFNYDRYIQKCKDIRIINSLRNLKDTPRFVTFNEYRKSLDPDSPEFMKKILRHHNYYFAFELSNFLGYENDKIYQRFCVANIKKIKDDYDDERLFNSLNRKLQECPNISYITLAKKCIKHNKYKLAEKFLKQEKSIVVKVPQYLELKNWSTALDLAIESNDRTVIKVVIDKIFKVENKKIFNKIVGEHPKAHKATIEYLRNHDQDDVLRGYLGSREDFEELLYMTLENFFKCKTIKDRKGYIIEAKKYLEKIKGNSNLDFYKQYISDLENSLKFKKACIDKAKIIQANDISPFDNSIFECYKLGVDSNYDFIESNNKNFNIGQKKVSYIRFKALAEKKKFDQIKEILANTNYKKLDISPVILAKIMYNVKNYDFAVELIKQSTDFNEFDEKIDLLRKMQKHRVALEIVLNDKKADKNRYINELLREKPELKKDLQELQNRTK